MKKHQWLFVLMIVLAVCITINWNMGLSDFPNDSSHVDTGYQIQSFHTDIVVKEDNSYDISETIQVYFLPIEQAGVSHGIYRYLPLNPQYVREIDGKIRKNYYKATVKNLTVDSEYDYEISDEDILIIQIGEYGTTVNGKTITYELSYNYLVGNDRYDTFDDFYLNVIGTGWTTKVNDISFKITFPTDLDGEDMKDRSFFYGGPAGGSKEASVILQTSASNVIEGRLDGSVSPGEALTIRTVLPNGYFSEVEPLSNTTNILIIVFTCVGIVFLLGLGVWGFTRLKVLPVVNFYPPKDMNPLQLKATFSATSLKSKDLAAMIIYWANKGYLKITQTEYKKPVITKIKDLPDKENSREKELFDNVVELYKDGSLNTQDGETRMKLGAALQAENVLLKTAIGSRSTKKSKTLAILGFIIWLGVIFIPMAYYWKIANSTFLLGTIGVVVVTAVILFILSTAMNSFDFDFSSSAKIGVSILLFILTLVLSSVVFSCLKDSTIISPAVKYLVAISIPLMFACLGKTFQYTEKLKKDLGDIYGFARNLLLVHNDKIKVLLKDNPNYFYDVLPYTYILGINKQFTKKFENIALNPPQWGDNAELSYIHIVIMCNNLSRGFASLPIKSSKISVGGSFGGGGGGGFSGGGGGGGGGGRW